LEQEDLETGDNPDASFALEHPGKHQKIQCVPQGLSSISIIWSQSYQALFTLVFHFMLLNLNVFNIRNIAFTIQSPPLNRITGK